MTPTTEARQLASLALKQSQTASGLLNDVEPGPVHDALYQLADGLSQVAVGLLALCEPDR